MRTGFVFPGGTARQQINLAITAEQAGWDAVFVWEAAYGVDAWTLLAAMAERTTRIQLGTMLTPLPWRRPWKLASQVRTLDDLSGGRAILAVGLGAVDTGLGQTGEVTDRRERGELLDEGIDLVRGFWRGDYLYEGKHYQADLRERADLGEAFENGQSRDIPIWVVGAWPRPKSMRRVLRCDGLLPYVMGHEATPDDIRDMRAWLEENGGVKPGFDIVMEGETPADDPAKAAEIVRPWMDAGCTWWLDARWGPLGTAAERLDIVRTRLEAGPPSP